MSHRAESRSGAEAPPRRQPKRRRPEPIQYAKHPVTGERVRVWEYDPCGSPLPWPEVLGNEPPPCSAPEPEEEDDTLLRYAATDPYESEEDD